MNMIPDNHLDRLGVVFDDDSLVSDAGLLVAGTLMSRRTFRHGPLLPPGDLLPPRRANSVFRGWRACRYRLIQSWIFGLRVVQGGLL